MSLSEKYWNEYYAKNFHQGKKSPTDFFQRMIPRLQRGKALDVAMGDGAHAVYLAQRGFQVKGFDISAVAVERALHHAGVSQAQIEAKQTDLDMYLFGLMEYDTVIMTYFKPPVKRYYSEMIRSLKQGGTLLVESYLTNEMKEIIPADEDFRNYYFKANELLHQLQGLRILFYHEGIEDGHHVLQCLAEKPLDKDVARYDAFGMMSSDKKTEKNSQREMLEALFKK